MPDSTPRSPSGEASLELAERIERLCLEYGRDSQLAAFMEDAGAADLLAAAVKVVVGEYAPEDMGALLDEIETVLQAAGLHGLTRSNREWRPLPGVRPEAEALTALVCPLDRCTRAEPGPAQTGPGCALSGRPLKTVLLQS